LGYVAKRRITSVIHYSIAVSILSLFVIVLASSGLADAQPDETAEDQQIKLLRSTLLGSRGYDELRAVEFDEEGDLLLLGYSVNPWFLDPSKGPDREFFTTRDPFIMKVSRDLTQVIWSTVLRGSFTDVPMDMALGPDGDVYIVGTTTSPDFTVTKGAYQQRHGGGGYDSFVCRLSGTNGSIVYCTGPVWPSTMLAGR
jgi:hypothetical protein